MLVSILKKIGIKFSLNDPRWGRSSQDDNNQMQNNKKPGEGPPDLDQLWRDFNQRITSLFGGKGGDGGDGYRPDAKGAGIGFGVVVLVAAFLWLVSGFFIVQEGQTGVVLTFGKYSNMTPAGFNWR